MKNYFFEFLKKVTKKITNTKTLFIIINVHEANLDDIKKTNNDSKGNLIIGEDENRYPPLCSIFSLFRAILELKNKVVTLLTTNYFAVALIKLKYILVADSKLK